MFFSLFNKVSFSANSSLLKKTRSFSVGTFAVTVAVEKNAAAAALLAAKLKINEASNRPHETKQRLRKK